MLQEEKQGYFERTTLKEKKQYEDRKKVAIAERNDKKDNLLKGKNDQKKEHDVPEVRKILFLTILLSFSVHVAAESQVDEVTELLT